MTRRITVAATAALSALLLITVQINMAAQTTTPAKTPAKTPVKGAPAKVAPAKAAPAKAAPAKIVQKGATDRVSVSPVELDEPGNSVTLIGCLEADGRKYKLTDLEGAQAEKSRDWKTGFVVKKAKDVEVTASPNVKLGDHIGHKVSVVGLKDGDAHLQARSIKQLAASCS